MIYSLAIILVAALVLIEPWALSLPPSVAVFISVISVGTSGLTQNYAKGDRWDKRLHLWQFISTSTAALVVYLGWGTVAAVSAALMGDFLFQVGVNLDARLPLVDFREKPTYDIGKTAMKKPFYGRGRYIQAGIGLLLIILLHPINHQLHEARAWVLNLL